jgi:signal transduction histidine kinase
MQPKPQLIVLIVENSLNGTLTDLLEKEGYRVGRVKHPSEASGLFPQDRPALVVRAAGPIRSNGSSADYVAKEASRLGAPLLDIVEDGAEPGLLVDRHGDADDWIYRSRVEVELPARVGRLVRRGEHGDADSGGRPTNPINPRFLALAVHDLRNPLNVIGLSLRMIDQAIPKNDPELLEDLRFVEENFKQFDRMLVQLIDYCRLFEAEAPLMATDFSPARMIGELVEDRSMKPGAGSSPLRLHIEESCPAEASLDPGRARLAIQYVLSNALASTKDAPVEITMRGGGPDRLITEVRIDRPPPPSVKSLALRPDTFERICGTADERRGLDLAIAARVSEMFGGTAQLDAVENRGTTVVLDWPTRLPTT